MPMEFRLGALGQFHVPARVPFAHGFALAAVVQFLARILADGFQQRVACFIALLALCDHQRFVHQLRENIQHSSGLSSNPSSAANGFGGLQRRAARKHRQSPQHDALGIGEQVVAPIDRGAQGLLARQGGAAAAGQQAKGIVQPRGDLLDAEHLHAAGGQLDRERNAVEPAADLGDGGCSWRR